MNFALGFIVAAVFLTSPVASAERRSSDAAIAALAASCGGFQREAIAQSLELNDIIDHIQNDPSCVGLQRFLQSSRSEFVAHHHQLTTQYA